MKSLCIVLLFCFYSSCFSQSYQLQIAALSDKDSLTIATISYKKTHSTQQLAVQEYQLFLEQLQKKGFLECFVTSQKWNNNQLTVQLVLGPITTHIAISMQHWPTSIKQQLGLQNDSLVVPIYDTENYLNQLTQKLANNGYPLAQLQLQTIKTTQNTLYSQLHITQTQLKKWDKLVIKGLTRFPKNIQKNLFRKFIGKTYQEKDKLTLQKRLDQLTFVKSTRPIEVLFEKDSTTAYVFVEKQNANTFDGFVGISNNNNQLKINGYADLQLINALNKGENLQLKWNNNSQQQTQFLGKITLPYLLQLPISLKAHLEIIKQDSLYQNTQTNWQLGYQLQPAHTLYIGSEKTTSITIAKTSNPNSSFAQQLYSLSSYWQLPSQQPQNLNFINLKIATGQRTLANNTTPQQLLEIQAIYHFVLSNNWQLQTKTNHYYLKGNNYLPNEAYRFGGTQSFRGFLDNSLLAHQLHSFNTEFRRLIGNNSYLHSITDFGYYNNRATLQKGYLYSLGAGIGLQTKSGQLALQYAIGKSTNSNAKNPALLHLSFISRF